MLEKKEAVTVEMVNVMQNIILDVNKAEEQVRIQVRNKDALSRVWRFWLVDDGEPVDLSPYYLATFEMKKGKDTAVSNACVINPKGYIDYTVTAGTVKNLPEGSFPASLKRTAQAT